MATFGYTSIGAGGSQDSADQKTFNKATLSENGTATSMSMYVAGAHSGYSTNMKFAIYNDNATLANATLVAVTEAVVVPYNTYDWYTANFSSGVPLTAGDYYIGGIGDDAWYWKYDSSASTTQYHVPDTYSDGLADPFGAGGSSSSTRLLSCYVTYTPGSAVSIPVVMHHRKMQGINAVPFNSRFPKFTSKKVI